ncbi:MAG: endonuclease III [Candidatus Amoebophilus sp.]
MTQEERYNAVIAYFTREPEIKTELHYENAFQLMIAVVLSAQCTDKRVNLVTPQLFEAFPTPVELAHSNFEEVFPYIKSISYPNNKTKYLIKAAQDIVEKFQGQVPEDVESLKTLAGVGRKSAHVIAAVLYNMPTLGVDTHVMRVSKRIGLVDDKAKTPLAIEKQLVQNLSETYIGKLNHWLVIHGRYTCLARKPKCSSCALTTYCLYFNTHHNKAVI